MQVAARQASSAPVPRNSTRYAVSSGDAQSWSSSHSSANGSTVIPVLTVPAEMVNALTPDPATSEATASVNRTRAALLAMYAEPIQVSGASSTRKKAAFDETLTMRPTPRAVIAGAPPGSTRTPRAR